MRRRSIAYAAAIAAMGFLILTAAPVRAAPATDRDVTAETATEPGKPLALTKAKTRVQKANRTRKGANKAARMAAAKAEKAKALQAKILQARISQNKASSSSAEPQIPDAVANANAQMPSADARGAASIGEAPALETAAAEQRNELGKSLTAPPADVPQQMAQLSVPEQPQSTLPLAAPEPNRPLKQARVTSSSNDAWAQSSLIGKIFIAFGGMLTLASAARMLIA